MNIVPSPLIAKKAQYAHDPRFEEQKYSLFPYSDKTFLGGNDRTGDITLNQPVAENETKYSGSIIPFFFNDYYNHIHVVPPELSLGNILNTQTRQVEIWNAYTKKEALIKITASGADGVVFNIEKTTFNALESKIYDVTISAQGNANLDALFTLTFDDEDAYFRVTGSRVTLFPFIPKMRFTESYEWLTDVIKTLKNEQRFLLRATPRRTLDYDFVFDALQFSRAKTVINQWINRNFAIPIWYDKERLDFLAINAEYVDIDSTYLEYQDGDSILIYEDEYKYEVTEVESIENGRINLKMPLTQDYTKPYVMPVKFGFLDDNNFTRTQNNIIEATTSFLITDNNDLPAIQLQQYNGYDVFLDCPLNGQSEAMTRDAETVDNELSYILKFDNEDITRLGQTLSYFKKTRAEVFAFKQWLYTRKGRQKAFWLPSFNEDLQLTKLIGSSETTITVKTTNFYLYGERTHLMLRTKDGKYFFNEVQSAQNNGDGTETLFISSPFNQEMAIEDVKSISFMNLVRLDSDRVEIEHLDFYMSQINISVVNVKE